LRERDWLCTQSCANQSLVAISLQSLDLQVIFADSREFQPPGMSFCDVIPVV